MQCKAQGGQIKNKMNKETRYGGVTYKAKDKGWQVNSWNPLIQKTVYVGFYKEEKEANDAVNEWNYNFFSENAWLLPKGISINRRDKAFSFSIIVRNRTIIIGTYKNLDEAVKAKLYFITKLI